MAESIHPATAPDEVPRRICQYDGGIHRRGVSHPGDPEIVTKDWHGLNEILRDVYPADVFTGASGDPGPTIVALLHRINETARLARHLGDCSSSLAEIRALKQVLVSLGVPEFERVTD